MRRGFEASGLRLFRGTDAFIARRVQSVGQIAEQGGNVRGHLRKAVHGIRGEMLQVVHLGEKILALALRGVVPAVIFDPLGEFGTFWDLLSGTDRGEFRLPVYNHATPAFPRSFERPQNKHSGYQSPREMQWTKSQLPRGWPGGYS